MLLSAAATAKKGLSPKKARFLAAHLGGNTFYLP
jgi:hypothetical protein